MSKISLKSSLLALSSGAVLLLFAACQTDQQPEITTQPTQQTIEAAKRIIVPTINPADQMAFESALKLADPSFCKKITDAEAMNLCGKALSDANISKEATNKMDATLCGKMSSEEAKKTCEIQIEYLKAEKAKEEAFQTENDKVNEIIKSGDIAGCKTISDENMSAGCEFNILINAGKIKSDGTTVCAKASTEATKTRCLEYYDSLPETAEQPDPINQPGQTTQSTAANQ